MARGELGTRHDPRTAVHVESAAVALVRVVGFVVVFETVSPAVVVHVEAEEILGPVHAVAQERFGVVGHMVGPHSRVVLVEIGNKIVVLVEAGKNRLVRVPLEHANAVPLVGCPAVVESALLVVFAVVVVVVVDEVVEVVGMGLRRVRVIDPARRIQKPHGGRVFGVHAEGLAEEVVRIELSGHVDHPRFGSGIAPNAR